jgi:hypothetical protein
VPRRTSISILLALIGIAAIWFGTQTVDQDHGPDPGGKVFVWGWLSTELWMNLWLVGLGMLLLVAAVVFFLVYPRLRRDRGGRRVAGSNTPRPN